MSSSGSRPLLYGLLAVAAFTRLLQHVSAMPPYAGLDEVYHVARLVFVANEGRNPDTNEPSIPRYLDDSIHLRGSIPSFADAGERWPEVMRGRNGVPNDGSGGRDETYVRSNYEAQQTSLYYSLIAPLRSLGETSALGELRVWRLGSVIFGVIVVLATAAAGETLFGAAGIAASAVLLLLPTWVTLVARAGNDAFACALLACAFAVTVRASKSSGAWVFEGLLWALALAAKLYTWPVAIVLPLLLWRQRAGRARVVLVLLLCALAVGWTLIDLRSRTENALGVVAFDRPDRAPLDATVDAGELVRVSIASFAWTSGQHWNALRPAAIALYWVPLLIAAALALRRARPLWAVPLAALVSFGAAQIFNVISCVLARRAGNDIPIGGKEGWYWYVLAPIVVASLVAPLLVRARSIAIAAFVWLAAWDVLIHESALFHDYAGTTSPAGGSALFRWGPLRPPFTANLDGTGVGPFEEWVVPLRIIELIAIGALLWTAASLGGAAASEDPVHPLAADTAQSGAIFSAHERE